MFTCNRHTTFRSKECMIQATDIVLFELEKSTRKEVRPEEVSL